MLQKQTLISIISTPLFILIATLAIGLFNSTTGFAQPADGEPAATEMPDATPDADPEVDADAEVPAEDDATEDDAPPKRKTMLEWMINSSGPIFGPIFLILSFVMVTLIIINFMQIRREVLIPTPFIEEFESKLNGKDLQSAYTLAQGEEAPIANVLAAGMGNLNRGYAESIEAMQEVGEEESMEIEHKLSYLALIAAVAPMIGLMGTVYGMILSFRVIESSPVAPSPKDLSGGIAKALFTTLEGLLVAIPAMIAYTILRNRSSRMMLDIGIISGRLMSRFSASGKSKPSASASSTKE